MCGKHPCRSSNPQLADVHQLPVAGEFHRDFAAPVILQSTRNAPTSNAWQRFANGWRGRPRHSFGDCVCQIMCRFSLLAKRPKRWWLPLCPTSMTARNVRSDSVCTCAEHCILYQFGGQVSTSAPNVSVGPVAVVDVSHGTSWRSPPRNGLGK
jgi:hypothetical protein